MGKQKRKPRKSVADRLTAFDRLELSEYSLVERLELFEWALEDQVKKGMITPTDYKYLIGEISKMIAESMEN